MPKDAKFGLVMGVGVVVLIAALFFQRGQDRSGSHSTPAVSSRPVAQTTAETAPKAQATTANVKQESGAASASVFSLASVAD